MRECRSGPRVAAATARANHNAPLRERTHARDGGRSACWVAAGAAARSSRALRRPARMSATANTAAAAATLRSATAHHLRRRRPAPAPAMAPRLPRGGAPRDAAAALAHACTRTSG